MLDAQKERGIVPWTVLTIRTLLTATVLTEQTEPDRANGRPTPDANTVLAAAAAAANAAHAAHPAAIAALVGVTAQELALALQIVRLVRELQTGIPAPGSAATLATAPTPTPATTPPLHPPGPQYVTLDQLAALVHRAKRSLENYRKVMPAPDIEGGGGRASMWDYTRSDVREWLSRTFGMLIPENFPGCLRGR
jgi:hypothetical protein